MKPRVLIAYVACSLVYIVAGDAIVAAQGETATALVKATPIALLLMTSALIGSNKWLPAALGFGACGDMLLAYQQFVPGLAAFLVGHVIYIVLWTRQVDKARLWYTLPVLIFAIVISWILIPYLGDMAVPVVIYIAVIVLMVASATISKLANVWGLLGVYSFLLSDLLIAWNRFVEPITMSGLLIMSSYYFAQIAIASSVLSQSKRHTPDQP